ncbi:MAG: cytochrome c oxidase subunit II transmembrane domain-containing protein, partial [Pseudomonadota bacterium]
MDVTDGEAALRALVSITLLSLLAGAASAQTATGVPTDGAIGFQPAATELAESAFWFHNAILMPIITAISVFVMGLLIFVMMRFNKRANTEPSKTTHNTLVEVIWTSGPVAILVIIAA